MLEALDCVCECHEPCLLFYGRLGIGYLWTMQGSS